MWRQYAPVVTREINPNDLWILLSYTTTTTLTACILWAEFSKPGTLHLNYFIFINIHILISPSPKQRTAQMDI